MTFEWIDGPQPDFENSPDYKPLPSREEAQARMQAAARSVDPDVANLFDERVTDAHVSRLNEAVKEIALTKMSEDSNAQARSELLRAKVIQKQRMSSKVIDRLVNEACAEAIGIDLNGHRSSSIDLEDDEDGWGGGEIQEVNHLVSGFVQERGTTVIAAQAGAGKTELMVAMCVALMTDMPFPPFDDLPTKNPGKILFIASDQDDNAIPQIEDSLYRCGVDGRNWAKGKIRVIAPNSAAKKPAWTATFKNLKKLKALVDTGDYGLVVIDSFRAIAAGTGWDATNNEQVLLLLKILKAVVTTKAALVLIHHTGEEQSKPGASITEMASAKALGQNVDIAYILKQGLNPDGSEADHRTLFGVKIRGGFERIQVHYNRDPETCQMKVDRTILPEASTTSDHILRVLSEGKQGQVKSADTISVELGVGRKTVSNLLQGLKTQKMVKMHGRGWVIREAGKRHLRECLEGLFTIPEGGVSTAYEF